MIERMGQVYTPQVPLIVLVSPSSTIRLLIPWATPVSITTEGWIWRTVHHIALHSSISASLYQPYV